VAGRQADAGFGLEAAAARFHLDFVPVASERYFLAIDAACLARADVRTLIETAGRKDFSAAINAIPGYRAECGEKLVTVNEAFGAPEAARPLR